MLYNHSKRIIRLPASIDKERVVSVEPLRIWQLTPWTELDVVLRLFMASIAGAVIGYERERAQKPAGVRTNLLVCLGAALLTIVSIYGFGGVGDPARVAAAVIVGIGFLGAGVILHGEKGVLGLTTAATVWSVAAVGLAFGCGLYLIAVITAVLILVALRFRTKHYHE